MKIKTATKGTVPLYWPTSLQSRSPLNSSSTCKNKMLTSIKQQETCGRAQISSPYPERVLTIIWAQIWDKMAYFRALLILLSVQKTATRTSLRKYSGTLSASQMKMTRRLLLGTAEEGEGCATILRSQTLPSLSMLWMRMRMRMGLRLVEPRSPNLNCCSVLPSPLPAHPERHIRRLRRRGPSKESRRRTSPCSDSSTTQVSASCVPWATWSLQCSIIDNPTWNLSRCSS